MNPSEEISWFRSRDAQSAIKHHLLQTYLAPWASIVKQKDVFFFDCFAGAGAYDDLTPGSPLIAAKILADIQLKFPRCQFHIRNVEHNIANYGKLLTHTQNFKGTLDIVNYHSSFPEIVPTLLQELEQCDKTRPALFFIDPFGYLDANPEPVKTIMTKEKREVIVNLMSYALVRASGIDEEQWKRGVHRILGNSDIPIESAKVEEKVLNTYCSQFRALGYFVCTVRIRTVEEPNIYFHLVHISRHWRALKEMKRAIRQNMKHQHEVELTRQNQISFFDEFDKTMTMNQYRDYILSTYARLGSTPYIDFINHELQYSPFDYIEIRRALKDLCEQKKIRITGRQDYGQQDKTATIHFLNLAQIKLL